MLKSRGGSRKWVWRGPTYYPHFYSLRLIPPPTHTLSRPESGHNRARTLLQITVPVPKRPIQIKEEMTQHRNWLCSFIRVLLIIYFLSFYINFFGSLQSLTSTRSSVLATVVTCPWSPVLQCWCSRLRWCTAWFHLFRPPATILFLPLRRQTCFATIVAPVGRLRSACTVWAKKTKPHTFVHIFAKYWPIFKIFSPEHSVENL